MGQTPRPVSIRTTVSWDRGRDLPEPVIEDGWEAVAQRITRTQQPPLVEFIVRRRGMTGPGTVRLVRREDIHTEPDQTEPTEADDPHDAEEAHRRLVAAYGGMAKTALQEVLDPYSVGRPIESIDMYVANTGTTVSAELLARAKQGDPGMRVLDIGCGAGMAIEQVAGRYPQAQCIGMDLNPLLTDKKHRASYIKADAQHLPLADTSIDVAYSSETLMYVPDPLKALTEAYRVLKPGGVAFFSYMPQLFKSPSLEEIIRKTGCEKEFSCVPGDVHTVMIRKSERAEFRGFPYRLVSSVAPAPGPGGDDELSKHHRAVTYELAA